MARWNVRPSTLIKTVSSFFTGNKTTTLPITENAAIAQTQALKEISDRIRDRGEILLPPITLEEYGDIFRKIFHTSHQELGQELALEVLPKALLPHILPTETQRQHIEELLRNNFFDTERREGIINKMLHEQFEFLGIEPIPVHITHQQREGKELLLPLVIVTPILDEDKGTLGNPRILIHPFTACLLTDKELAGQCCHEIIHHYRKHITQINSYKDTLTAEQYAGVIRETEEQADYEGAMLHGDVESYTSGLVKIIEAIKFLDDRLIMEELGKMRDPSFLFMLFGHLDEHPLDLLLPGIGSHSMTAAQTLAQSHRINEVLQDVVPEVPAVRRLLEGTGELATHPDLERRLHTSNLGAKTPKENFPFSR